MLEARHDVLAPTLPGHWGGPPLADAPAGALDALADALERVLDDAGLATAHIAGTSLGGHLALRLAARGRARSVVALAPAGGWADGDDLLAAEVLPLQRTLVALARSGAAHADAASATAEGRRRAMELQCEDAGPLAPDVVADAIRAVAGVDRRVLELPPERWDLDAERLTGPIRIVWGAADRILPWPRAAAGLQATLPHADWVLLDGIGHGVQLDAPLEAAQLILGLTA